ncbi:thiol-disulfide isomerase/thioredoxin [Luteimonas sp. RC10]|nr:thiol-disulfide isomerase/thioredoxin [Luteimonas sp. RC10]
MRGRWRVAALAALLSLLAPLSVSASGDDASRADPALRAVIDAALVRPDGVDLPAYRWDRPPEIVALYFGADWCAPCHAFSPTLREVRDALRAAGADTEVVYASLDESAAQMRRTMRLRAMPWPAIEPRRLRMLGPVRALGGIAPPNLVLVDREGRVLASGWDGRRYLGLQPVLQAWVAHFAASGVLGQRADLRRPAARIKRDHHEAAARAQLALAADQVLGDHLDLDLHRGAPDLDHPRDGLHQLPLADRQLEIDLLRAGGDDGQARIARGGDERGLVHPRQCLAAEQRAQVVGVVGEDDLQHPGFGGGGGCDGGGHGGVR